jgi:lipoprotein-anchoring transpeptidase ErfK/SrfK
MANEIAIGHSLRINKGFLRLDLSATPRQTDMAGTDFVQQVQAIGNAAHEELVIPSDIANKGWGMVQNNSAANSVDIGVDDVGDGSGNFIALLRLGPGDSHPVRWHPTVRVWAKATASSVDLQWAAVEV